MAEGDNWRWPPWLQDVTNVMSRVAVPEAGGWMYQFRHNEVYTHVFAPDMAVWAEAIAEAIARPKNTAVALVSIFEQARDIKQPVPGSGGSASR